MDNLTSIEGFILLGITDEPNLQIFLFAIFLMFYLFILTENLGIFLLVVIVQSLHKLMYFFLANLSLLDISCSTITVPKMLSGLLTGDKTIYFLSCAAQLHFFHFLGSSQAFILSAMSYDRYVAICNPLRYHDLMGRTSCIQLASTCWLLVFLYSSLQTMITFRLPYCNRRQVIHFYCDVKPVMKLACADTELSELLSTVIFAILAVSAFFLTIVSYTCIGRHLLNIRCNQERQKAFFTCTSHITVVILYFGTVLSMYLSPTTEDSLEQTRISALLVTVITPALNPFIYTIRNKEVKKAVQRALTQKQQSSKLFMRKHHVNT